MKYVANIDIAGTPIAMGDTVQEVLAKGGVLQNITITANGNYEAVIAFTDRQVLFDFLTEWHASEGEEWIDSLISEEFDESDFDMSKWTVMPLHEFVNHLISVVEAGGDQVKLATHKDKLIVSYPQTNQDSQNPIEFDGPALMALKDGDRIKTYETKNLVPNF